jgi:hypothetical protein
MEDCNQMPQWSNNIGVLPIDEYGTIAGSSTSNAGVWLKLAAPTVPPKAEFDVSKTK